MSETLSRQLTSKDNLSSTLITFAKTGDFTGPLTARLQLDSDAKDWMDAKDFITVLEICLQLQKLRIKSLGVCPA